MVFVNMKETTINLDFDWNKHEIGDNLNNRNLDTKNSIFKIRDLFKHENLGTTANNLNTAIGPHDVLMITLE